MKINIDILEENIFYANCILVEKSYFCSGYFIITISD